MASIFDYTEGRQPARYSYRLSRSGLNQRTTLMPGDIFKFTIRVFLNTTPLTLLLYCPSQTVPCHSFFQDGQFLQTVLSRIRFFVVSCEEITQGVIFGVRKMFQVDGVASPPPSSLESQHQEIPIWLEITLYNSNLLASMEESSEIFGLIPASNEVIQMSLKKCTVMTKGECCPICKEELDVSAECRTMPCDHAFHLQCIVTWLQINHVCPLCRSPLPTLKD